MALSKTDIANQALGRVGQKAIMDLNDTTSPPARVCNNVFEQSVRELGRLAEWQCLTKRVELGQLSSDPDFGWDHQYQLPADYLRMIKLNGLNAWEAQDFYVIEGKRILCDEDEAKIVYVAYVEDSTQYDALFTSALAVLIASKIAVPLRQDEALADRLLSEFETKTLPSARRIDGNEAKKRQYNYFRESKWLKSRISSTNG